MKLPSFTRYHIYDCKSSNATGVILIGYCGDNLEMFTAMYKQAKKTFPNLKPSDVTCSKVTQSNCIKGFTIILFRVPNPQKKYPGWTCYESGIDFNY